MTADRDILQRYRVRVAVFEAMGRVYRRRSVLPVDGPREICPAPADCEPIFSARERGVLVLVSEGLSNAEIGAVLYISEETVKSHVRSLLSKLCARNRAHAVALGVRSGLIELQ